MVLVCGRATAAHNWICPSAAEGTESKMAEAGQIRSIEDSGLVDKTLRVVQSMEHLR